MGKQAASRDKAPQNLLLALQEAQHRFGCLPPDFMAELADSLGVPVNDVYGVATFYSFLSVKPLGRNVIRSQASRVNGRFHCWVTDRSSRRWKMPDRQAA